MVSIRSASSLPNASSAFRNRLERRSSTATAPGKLARKDLQLASVTLTVQFGIRGACETAQFGWAYCIFTLRVICRPDGDRAQGDDIRPVDNPNLLALTGGLEPVGQVLAGFGGGERLDNDNDKTSFRP